MKVACPTCGQLSEYAPSNRWRPFCSGRCRSIDLGAWASEAYAIPAKEEGSPEGAEPDRGDSAG
ncbi:MAG TPA: DNA gyrase inhibitor YacG [Usitatibacter sp.]|nr:DNA gyrase inhibitor YacG [Usitatibacter sp.]